MIEEINQARCRIPSFSINGVDVCEQGVELWLGIDDDAAFPILAARVAPRGPMEWVSQTAKATDGQLPRSGHMVCALPADHAADLIMFGGYTEDTSEQVKSKMPPFNEVPKREPSNGAVQSSRRAGYV